MSSFQVVVAPGCVVHKGTDLDVAATILYAEMQKSLEDPLGKTVIFLQDGEILQIFSGKDFIEA